MHAAQHLVKDEIERPETALATVAGWRSMIAIVRVFRRVGASFVRMPRRMHKRALLSDKQQDNTNTMENPA